MSSDHAILTTPAPEQLVVFWGTTKQKQTLKKKGISNRKFQVLKNAAGNLKLPVCAKAPVEELVDLDVVVLCDGENIHTTLDLVWADIVEYLTNGEDCASMVHDGAIRVLMPVADTAGEGAGTVKTRKKATDGRGVCSLCRPVIAVLVLSLPRWGAYALLDSIRSHHNYVATAIVHAQACHISHLPKSVCARTCQ